MFITKDSRLINMSKVLECHQRDNHIDFNFGNNEKIRFSFDSENDAATAYLTILNEIYRTDSPKLLQL